MLPSKFAPAEDAWVQKLKGSFSLHTIGLGFRV